MRLHSLVDVFFGVVDFLQWPALQQSCFAPGNMKNCGQDTQPPHRSVVRVRSATTDVNKERNTSSVILSQRLDQNPTSRTTAHDVQLQASWSAKFDFRRGASI